MLGTPGLLPSLALTVGSGDGQLVDLVVDVPAGAGTVLEVPVPRVQELVGQLMRERSGMQATGEVVYIEQVQI